jgi:hypothetical protein
VSKQPDGVSYMAALKRQRFSRLRSWWWLRFTSRKWVQVGATEDEVTADG